MNREPITLCNLLMRRGSNTKKYVWRNYQKGILRILGLFQKQHPHLLHQGNEKVTFFPVVVIGLFLPRQNLGLFCRGESEHSQHASVFASAIGECRGTLWRLLPLFWGPSMFFYCQITTFSLRRTQFSSQFGHMDSFWNDSLSTDTTLTLILNNH
jgi:hypothetical protein